MTIQLDPPRAATARAKQGRLPETGDLLQVAVPSDPRIAPDGTQVVWTLTESDIDEDRNATSLWTAAPDQDARRLTQGPFDAMPRWSPDGRWLAFLRRQGEATKPQVWLLPIAGGEPRELTSLAEGASDLAWAPDSRRILVCSWVDAHGDIPDKARSALPRATRTLQYKADGAGLMLERWQHLFVVDLDGGGPRQLTAGEWNAGHPAWSPDGEQVAFVSARESEWDLGAGNNLYVVAASGGAVRRVTEVTGSVSCPVWAPDGEAIVFAGSDNVRADQFAGLWRVTAEGGVPDCLTPAFDYNVMPGSAGYPGFLPHFVDGTIVFAARDQGCVRGYRLDIGSRPVQLVGGAEEVVSGLTSAQSGDFAYVASGPLSAGQVFRASASGATLQLTQLNRDLLAGIRAFQPEARAFMAADGTTINGWLLRSDDMKSPAPLLLDVHGGPHNAWTSELGLAAWYQQVLAGRGWTILKLNVRGSDGYGQNFMSAAKGAWGRADLADFTTAIDALVDEGIADRDRLAITGYSYGGYMTNWAVTQTRIFKAAVSGGCVTNLSSFFGTSDIGPTFAESEIGGRPYENGEHYREVSPITYAENVMTPTLILHGQADERCPVGQAEEFFVALRVNGVETELVLYPGASHAFKLLGRPSHRVDYCRRLIDWLERYIRIQH